MRIAIVGCGQLSRMLALAGIPMGLKFSFINDNAQPDTTCVDGLGKVVAWQPGDEFSALYAALGEPDVVTVEKEQMNVELLIGLQAFCPVHPNPDAVKVCQDRHQERLLLDKLNIPCAGYVYGEPLDVCAEKLSLPMVIKSCRDGYDGKNQWVLKTPAEVMALEAEFAGQQPLNRDYIAEQFVPFDREVSQVSARSVNGDMRHYPLTENRHDKGILKQSIAPAPGASDQLQQLARQHMASIASELDYAGVLAVEFFVCGEQLLVNELAPRVHNSGHWTQSGSDSCQFENHLRAITGIALGSTAMSGVAGMVNLIGTEKPALSTLTADSKLHWYDKSVRPGRKLGHMNFKAANTDLLLAGMSGFSRSLEG